MDCNVSSNKTMIWFSHKGRFLEKNGNNKCPTVSSRMPRLRGSLNPLAPSSTRPRESRHALRGVCDGKGEGRVRTWNSLSPARVVDKSANNGRSPTSAVERESLVRESLVKCFPRTLYGRKIGFVEAVGVRAGRVPVVTSCLRASLRVFGSKARLEWSIPIG